MVFFFFLRLLQIDLPLLARLWYHLILLLRLLLSHKLMAYLASSPCVSTCSCTEPLHTAPTISHDNKIVETCALCNGIIMPARPPPVSPFRFLDLSPEVRGMILGYFAGVPPYPLLRANKPHAVDAVNVERGIIVSFTLCYLAIPTPLHPSGYLRRTTRCHRLAVSDCN